MIMAEARSPQVLRPILHTRNPYPLQIERRVLKQRDLRCVNSFSPRAINLIMISQTKSMLFMSVIKHFSLELDTTSSTNYSVVSDIVSKPRTTVYIATAMTAYLSCCISQQKHICRIVQALENGRFPIKQDPEFLINFLKF